KMKIDFIADTNFLIYAHEGKAIIGTISMKKSTSTILTKEASSYIGKLCRHFRHKIAAEYTATSGLATFPAGTCTMEAIPDQLIFNITAPDSESVEKIKGVLER